MCPLRVELRIPFSALKLTAGNERRRRPTDLCSRCGTFRQTVVKSAARNTDRKRPTGAEFGTSAAPTATQSASCGYLGFYIQFIGKNCTAFRAAEHFLCKLEFRFFFLVSMETPRRERSRNKFTTPTCPRVHSFSVWVPVPRCSLRC